MSIIPSWMKFMTQLTSLVLNDNMIYELPDFISTLTNLVELTIDQNALSTLPTLTSLEQLSIFSVKENRFPDPVQAVLDAPELSSGILNLSALQMSFIPDSALHLPWAITEIDLSANKLTRFPPWLSACPLQSLNIDENQVSEFPDYFTKLTQLRVFRGNSNQFGNFPSMTHMTVLTSLSLRNNLFPPSAQVVLDAANLSSDILDVRNKGLTELSDVLCQLPWTPTRFDLSENQLSTLPEWIGLLTQIKQLKLSSNQFTELPSAVSCLTQLEEITLDDNKIDEVPDMRVFVNLLRFSIAKNPASRLLLDIGNLVNLRPNQIDLAGQRQVELSDYFYLLPAKPELDIARNRFNTLPQGISRMTHLKRLIIHQNQIVELPEWITLFKRLESLDIEAPTGAVSVVRAPKGITELPCWKSTQQGKGLKKLELFAHNVYYHIGKATVSLPGSSSEWAAFTRIDVSDNKLTALPSAMGGLKKLKALVANNNQIASLPASFSSLSLLTELQLSNNQLATFPAPICDMRAMLKLYLNRNPMTNIPEKIEQLKKLLLLDIRYTKVSRLPNSLGTITSMTDFRVDHVPIEYPPPNIVAKGFKEIINYLQAIIKSGTITWLECRLLLLGEGTVGKTTLSESLAQNEANFKSPCRERERTNGAEVSSTPLVFDKIKPHVRASIWDFGGQEIFQVTHPFFLSHGALTLVLYSLELGPKASLLSNWLEVLNYFIPNSRVVIVGTRLDMLNPSKGGEYDRDLQQICDEYKSKLIICACHKVSNHTGAGIGELKTIIQRHMLELPNVNQLAPKSYIELKERLEKKRREDHPFLLLSEVYPIAEKLAKMNETETKTALSFLHDLGAVVWNSNIETLRRHVHLDPILLIDIFKTVFTLQSVALARGSISNEELRTEIEKMLQSKAKSPKAKVDPTVVERLLQMAKSHFRHFGLSVRVDDNWEIFPLLLPDQEPPLEMWPHSTFSKWGHQLTYVIRYPVRIPKSVISRLLVQLQDIMPRKPDALGKYTSFCSKNVIVFDFALPQGSESISVGIGRDFKARIDLIEKREESTQKPFATIDKLVISITVRNLRPGLRVVSALLALSQMIKRAVPPPRGDQYGGYACPVCLLPEHCQTPPSLHPLHMGPFNTDQFNCSRGHSLSYDQYEQYHWPLEKEVFSGDITTRQQLSISAKTEGIVKVFVSSTFRDLKDEREYFTKIIQPPIELEAEEYGVTMIFLDLRWGVTDHEAKTGQTIYRCLEEVEKADYFVCILKSRYGWIPDRNNPNEWSTKTNEDFPWVKQYKIASATELEIRSAYFIPQPTAYRVFFYFSTQHDDNPDPIDAQKQQVLKDEIIHEKGLTVHSFDDNESLGHLVKAHLIAALSKDFPMRPKDLWDEQHYQAHFERKKTQFYVGDPDFVSKVVKLIENRSRINSHPPIILHGDAGTGKSALIGHLKESVKLISEFTGVMTSYYVLASPETDSPMSVTRFIRNDLAAKIKELDIEAASKIEMEGNLTDLVEILGHLSTTTFCIFIDDADLVRQSKSQVLPTSWIPSSIPGNVEIVCTAQNAVDQFESISITPLSSKLIARATEKYFEAYSKNLSEDEIALISSNPLLGIPGHLRVVLSDLVQFGSYEELKKRMTDLSSSTRFDQLLGIVVRSWDDTYGFASEILKVLGVSSIGMSKWSMELLQPFGKMKQSVSIARSSEMRSSFLCLLLRDYLKSRKGRYFMSDILLKYTKANFQQDFAQLLESSALYVELLEQEFRHHYHQNNTAMNYLIEECWSLLYGLTQYGKGKSPQTVIEAFTGFVCQDEVVECVAAASGDLLQKMIDYYVKWKLHLETVLSPHLKNSCLATVCITPALIKARHAQFAFDMLQHWISREGELTSIDARARLHDWFATVLSILGRGQEEEHRKIAKELYAQSRGFGTYEALNGTIPFSSGGVTPTSMRRASQGKVGALRQMTHTAASMRSSANLSLTSQSSGDGVGDVESQASVRSDSRPPSNPHAPPPRPRLQDLRQGTVSNLGPMSFGRSHMLGSIARMPSVMAMQIDVAAMSPVQLGEYLRDKVPKTFIHLAAMSALNGAAFMQLDEQSLCAPPYGLTRANAVIVSRVIDAARLK
eukprot:TRINITY_DN4621_c0_g1_i1.p1 TRINITY_DN4621_c0_g1~~TRINITY_DN4621_c0_g1_i1.p1  ORF type:complete len:2100 (-),score=412.11 TRINITY_DN4621_c0_g1_i1:48-6347(-)